MQQPWKRPAETIPGPGNQTVQLKLYFAKGELDVKTSYMDNISIGSPFSFT